MKKHLIAGAMGLAFAGTALAEPIETIIVTGAKTPITQAKFAGQAIVIDAATIHQSKAVSLSELLKGVAGIAISQSGGLGALSELRMRGSESNHTLIMLNSIPLNDLGQGGVANLAHLAVNNIARIEIIKGGQSALWGSGAIGGVINIITTAGDDNSSQLSAEISEHNGARVSANHQQNSGNIKFSVGLAYQTTAGENISVTGDENDGYDNLQLNSRGSIQLSSDSELSYSALVTDAKNEYDAAGPVDADNYSDVQQQQLQLQWAWQQGAIKHTVGVNHNAQKSASYNANVFASEATSSVQTASWLSHLPLTRGHINLQGEYLHQEFENDVVDTQWGDPNQRQDNRIVSAIIDTAYDLSDSLTINASARFDDNQLFDDASSINLGGVWQVMPTVSVFSSYSEAVKNPTFTEIFGYTPASFIGNPNLKPESSTTVEVGANLYLENWTLSISRYDSALEQEIGTQYNADFTSTSFNAVNDSDRRGTELSLQGELMDWSVNASYAHSKSLQSDNTAEFRRPENAGQVQLSRIFYDDKLSVFLQGTYQGSQRNNNFNVWPYEVVTLSSYTLLNSTLTYNFTPEVSAYFKAFNLLGNDYQDVLGYQGRGRTLSLGVTYSL